VLSLRPALEVVRALGEVSDREQLDAALTRAIRAVLPVDQVGIMAAIGERIVQVCADPPLAPGQVRFATKSDVPANVLARAHELHVVQRRDIVDYPLARAMWDAIGIESSMPIPLFRGGELIGAINNWSRDADAFRHVDREAAAELGAAMSIAVDRLVMTDELAGLQAAELSRISWRLDDVEQRLARVAPTDTTVLITGESGTGKDVLAHRIHQASERRTRPMVTLDCASIPSTLAESELFGHEAGAFTGAARSRRGKFEAAHGGTLFLDEVGELPLALQAKLLRVLQERELERVGGHETVRVDVRVIAATNRDLAAEVARGRFREDLYYRLAVFPIHLPPLRDRKHDLPALVETLVDRAAERLRVPRRSVGRDALRRLARHDWPGNIRELQNVIERAMILSRGEALEVDAILPSRSRR
jgi:transcriptional regulator with GAF, ATPase, and Fis domain